jgi:ABC-type hemin transport system substrate-binding protein
VRYCIGSMRMMRPTSNLAPQWHAAARCAARAGVALVAAVTAMLGGCGESGAHGDRASGPVPAAPAGPAGPEAPTDALRIASLSPAMTECLVELGLGGCIVGRTPWCQTGAERVPVVGTLLDIDVESLVRCEPDVIVVQPPAQGMDPSVQRLADAHGWRVHAWRIDGLDDARATMRGLVDAVHAAVGDVPDGVRERHRRWEGRLDAALMPIPRATEPGGAPRALVVMGGIEGIAFGRGSYLDDALSRLGVRNALDRPGYPSIGMEDIIRMSPDVIVVVGSRGAPALPEGSLQRTRVVCVDGRGLAVPGGFLPDGIAALREALANALAREQGPSGGAARSGVAEDPAASGESGNGR